MLKSKYAQSLSQLRRQGNEDSGFTLAEVVIASVIIAAVIAAFTVFMTNIAKIQDSASLDRIATRVMSSELDRIVGAKWDDLMMPPSSGAVSPCIITSTRTSYQIVQPGPTTVTVDGLPVSIFRSVVWNGTLSTITNAIGSGSSITYTAANNYSAGKVVSIYGVTPSIYNIANAVITSATGTQFTIANTITGTYSNGGNAGVSVYCSGVKDANDLKVVTVSVTWLDSTAIRTRSTSVLRSAWTTGVKLL